MKQSVGIEKPLQILSVCDFLYFLKIQNKFYQQYFHIKQSGQHYNSFNVDLVLGSNKFCMYSSDSIMQYFAPTNDNEV